MSSASSLLFSRVSHSNGSSTGGSSAAATARPAPGAPPAASSSSSSSSSAFQHKSSKAALAELDLKQFGFHACTSFDATKDLQNFRSKHFQLEAPPEDHNVWKRPPPDFRKQAWVPVPPKRNTREAMQPWRYKAGSDHKYEQWKMKEEEVKLPVVMRGKRRFGRRGMDLLSRELRPNTARMLGITNLSLPADPYQSPQPHDFRGYPPIRSLGLDEFETKIEKDPYNIKFLTENKNTIIGPLHETKNLRDASGTLWSAVRQPVKWHPSQHLPLGKWPAKCNEYTRYRVQHLDPHEGFLDRVDELVTKKWSSSNNIITY